MINTSHNKVNLQFDIGGNQLIDQLYQQEEEQDAAD